MKLSAARILYAKEAVRNGVKLLDKVEPGWEKKIDLTRLDLSSTRCCMLGQIYGEYNVNTLRLSAFKVVREFSGRYSLPEANDTESQAKFGFEAPRCIYDSDRLLQPYFSLLTELWTAVIEKRRKKDVAKERVRRQRINAN